MPCLDSALQQTVGDLEVVVVDGASTDRTWEVCRAFADRDPRVRIFRDPENTGPVRGWWRCIEEARGRFATFLWSDDVLMATFLEHTLPFVADEDVAFAYTAAEIGLRPGEGRVAYAIPGTSELPSDAFIRGSLTTRGRFPMSPACALFRLTDLKRNFVTEVPDPPADLTSTGAGVDILFYLLTASQRPRVHHVSVPLAFFRAHPNSISIDGRGGLVDRHYAAAKIWFARSHGFQDLVPTVVAWHWLATMRASRRFLTPASAEARYGKYSSTLRLVGSATRIVGAQLFALGGRLRQPRMPNRERP